MWVSSNIQLSVCILHSTSLSLSPTFAPLYLHLWLFFICIIFSIPHSHPSSVCFTFELLRWLFYFSFFYSNYIFHRSFYIVCRPSTSSFSFFTSLSIAAACVCVYFCVDKVEAHYMSSIPALHFTAVAFKMHYNVLWIRTQRVQRFVNELRTSSVPHHSETRSEWDDFKIENTMEKKEETKIHHPYTYTSTE